MNANEIKEYSENWYTLGRSFLPEFNSPRFATIAGEANSFVYQVAPRAEGIIIKVVNGISTAYVDLAKGEIAISSKYFSNELYAERYDEDGKSKVAELAIALINGSVIHEALHVKHTTFTTIKAAVETHKEFETFKKHFGMKVLCTAFNIIEDLYIEQRVNARHETWLQATSDILFQESDLDDIENPMTDLEDYLNLAIMFKNKELRSNAKFELFSEDATKALDHVVNSRRVMHIAERIETTYDFLRAFEGESSEGDGEGEPSEDEDGEAGEGGGKAERGEGEIPEALKKILDEIDEMSEEELEALAEEIEETSKEISEEAKTDKTFRSRGSEAYWKILKERDVMRMPTRISGYDHIKPINAVDVNFLKELVAKRTLNRTPGAARTRGSVMVKSRLTRIATDGKIFAKRDTERFTLKRIEVIINIDFSGSTSGYVIDNEVGCAMEMSKTLRAARIAHSVYAHTSGPDSRSQPLLIHIFSHDMEETNQNWDERFAKAAKLELAENYDGVVMEALQEKFTDRGGSKYIINLSDGSPAGPGYHGRAADDHTRSEIEKARKRGIGVFAISVVSGVVVANDRIYGSQFNVDGSKNTAAQFRTLIGKLVS